MLHSRSPEMPLEDIYSVIREELGKEVWCTYVMFFNFRCDSVSRLGVRESVSKGRVKKSDNYHFFFGGGVRAKSDNYHFILFFLTLP